MARKITKEAVNAFMSSNSFSSSNTKIIIENGRAQMFLFSHLIAIRYLNKITISNADHFTNTTKERLNGIPGVSISQKAGIWYLNGNEWNGNWIEIK